MSHQLKQVVPQSIKNIYHLICAILANFYYCFPSRRIKVIGVTGTDGKTTTVQMIVKILEEAGKKTALASTINFKIGNREWKNLSHYTTLSSFGVQKFISQAVKENCEYLIMETSSHSLDQYRVWGVKYKTAVITNITREHLDYHKTMGKYRKAKLKLFKKTDIAIINLDMENPEEYLACKAKLKFGFRINSELNLSIKKSNNKQSINLYNEIKKITAEDVAEEMNYSKFRIQNSEFLLNIPGRFNIENALAAVCVGVSENIPLEICAKALRKIENVSGRLETVPNNLNLDIRVDFALTPNALEKLYKFLNKTKKEKESKIIAVFGACGERDRGKRPIVGKIVSDHADIIIVTNDEPYFEDSKKIINEIVVGIKNKKEKENLFIIPDRREAIKMALKLAKSGDIIAVTGMGAEESMIVKDKKIPWNDKKVILEELQKL